MKIGDLITDGHYLFLVLDLQSYNGYKGTLMIMQRIDTGETEFTTNKDQFTLVDQPVETTKPKRT